MCDESHNAQWSVVLYTITSTRDRSDSVHFLPVFGSIFACQIWIEIFSLSVSYCSLSPQTEMYNHKLHESGWHLLNHEVSTMVQEVQLNWMIVCFHWQWVCGHVVGPVQLQRQTFQSWSQVPLSQTGCITIETDSMTLVRMVSCRESLF